MAVLAVVGYLASTNQRAGIAWGTKGKKQVLRMCRSSGVVRIRFTMHACRKLKFGAIQCCWQGPLCLRGL